MPSTFTSVGPTPGASNADSSVSHIGQQHLIAHGFTRQVARSQVTGLAAITAAIVETK